MTRTSNPTLSPVRHVIWNTPPPRLVKEQMHLSEMKGEGGWSSWGESTHLVWLAEHLPMKADTAKAECSDSVKEA